MTARRSLGGGWRIGCAVLLLALVPMAPSLAQATNRPPALSPINADNQPPTAHYDVLATDEDGDPLTYTWSLQPAEASCTAFEQNGNAAAWHHHQSDGCSHESVEHAGTITVTVTDGHFTCTATYPNGTATGVGPAPGPCTSNDGSTPPPEEPPPGSTPGGEPTNDPGLELVCPPPTVSGYFEPSQGVFQDDTSFADGPGRQLRRLSPNSYEAELPMVANRPTALFGIDHADDGFAPRDRYNIVLDVTTNYVTPAPVMLELLSHGAASTLGRELVPVTPATVPLLPPCGPTQTVRVRVPAPNGIPAGRFFEFTEAGRYLLTAELITGAGQGSGLRVTVGGQVVETRSPEVDAFPVIFGPLDASSASEAVRLPALAHAMASIMEANIPDYFPVPDGSLSVGRRPLIDVSSFLQAEIDARRGRRDAWQTKLISLLQSAFHDTTDAKLLEEEIRSFEAGGITRGWLRKWFGVASALTGGRRAVIVLRGSDYAKIDIPEGSGALTISQKVILMPDRNTGRHTTVGHELAHTLPFAWLGDPGSACGVTYHNVRTGIAHGHTIHHAGTNHRKAKRGDLSIMGPVAHPFLQWIDQCTYAHLVDVLQNPPDPPLFVVSGRLATSGDAAVGQLLPAYQLDGVPDLVAGAGGDHAIVLRDASGAALERFPFTPEFVLPTHPPRRTPITGFTYRVPRAPGTALIDLVGPTGLLDRLTVSDSEPTVAITAPEPATLPATQRAVDLTWRATDADGDNLLSTVLYSADGGDTFGPLAVEQEAQSLRVELAPASHHVLKVVVTDGARSAEQIVELRQSFAGPCPPAPERPPFLDVAAGSTHAAAIACAQLWRIVNGTGDGLFGPGRAVSRGELATIVARLLERVGDAEPAVVEDAFDDDDGSVHEAAINRLAAAGIIRGVAERTVDPDGAVSRAQAASVLHRTILHLGAAPTAAPPDAFDDDRGSVHEPAIDALAGAEIVVGREARTFAPGDATSRAQAATLLVRVLEHLGADVP